MDANAKLPTSSFCNLINSEFQVVLRDSNPVYTRQYLIPQDIQPAVHQRIKKWVDNGWVKKWDKNSKNVWNSLLLAVPKRSGGVNEADDIRLCIDLRKVNSKSKEPIYTLPTPVEMFRTVGGVKFFTEIDLFSAYHHIKVEEDSQPLLGFVDPQGIQYVWMRLPFGSKGAVTHFQAQGERTILGIEDVISYLDNFLVAS